MLSVSLRFTCVQAWRNVSTNVSCCLRPFQLNGSGTVADFSQYFCAFFSSVSVCKCEWVFFFSLLRFLFSFFRTPRALFPVCAYRERRSTTPRLNASLLRGEQCTFFVGVSSSRFIENRFPFRHCYRGTRFSMPPLETFPWRTVGMENNGNWTLEYFLNLTKRSGL